MASLKTIPHAQTAIVNMKILIMLDINISLGADIVLCRPQALSSAHAAPALDAANADDDIGRHRRKKP